MEHLKETFLFRLCLGLFALALAALLGSLVGSFFSDHTFFDGWNSASAIGHGLGRAVLALPLLWVGIMRVSRGLGVLFGELTLPLYLFTGRWRHLLLAAGLEFLEFAVYSSLTVTVGSSV